MKIRSSFVLPAGFGFILAAVPVVAHHSFAAQYDRSKPITITGPVTKIDWINPHARFFIDVKDDNAKTINWEVELGPPAGLMRRGWTRNSLKVGESVTVNGFLAKDGSNLANAQTVTLGDGRKIFAGSSSDSDKTP
jgi:hypothetical protein